jgi:hypothetical protein
MRKSHRPKITKADTLACHDESLKCCLNIMAVAGLLECSNSDLNPETIARAGLLILEEAEKLHKRLELLFGV